MDVFSVRNRLVRDYADYVESFISISDSRIGRLVHDELERGLLWPEPLIQLNPTFEPGDSVDELVGDGVLHPECARYFRMRSSNGDEHAMRFHRHQSEAIRKAHEGHNYVLTTGTGSGKSLAYIVPIVDHVLRNGSGRGIQAIVVYPMNALANSQLNELSKFLRPDDGPEAPVTFRRYTGQESTLEKEEIRRNPPDILLTNYVMLELIMTRTDERPLIEAARGLRFLVFDELHTYRGRQGADVTMLIRRVRERLEVGPLQCVGTSATMSSEGTTIDKRRRVAEVAGTIFGVTIGSEHIVGETIRPATRLQDPSDPALRAELLQSLSGRGDIEWRSLDDFTRDPLAVWLENTFGLLKEPGTGALVRATPISIGGPSGAAARLHADTGIDMERCRTLIAQGLLAGTRCEPDPVTGKPPFAFRLHQFFGRGDTVYATLLEEEHRFVTVEKQSKEPGTGNVLRPLVFCRECGHEYYAVRRAPDHEGERFDSRDLRDQYDAAGAVAGFLYRSERAPWPDDLREIVDRIPEDWVEQRSGETVVRKSYRDALPKPVRVGPDGRVTPDGLPYHFVGASLRFCLCCGVTYGTWQQNDFMKLATLSSEGRSTATTILGLAALRELHVEGVEKEARKLLSFTDNRQDASLQAGHFNDFVEIARLRAALYRAAQEAGPDGLTHLDLESRVFNALGLPFEAYARNPDVRYHARQETERALREMLGYRLYCDQRRGWRITQPNLEQSGLLHIVYGSLQDLCDTDRDWAGCHPGLADAAPGVRLEVARTLLDYMRRELAVSKECLSAGYQGALRALSSQHLNAAWGLGDAETLETSRLVVPRARTSEDKGIVAITPRGGYGQYLRRTLRDGTWAPAFADLEKIIADLLALLASAGIVLPTELRGSGGAIERAYQVASSAMRWIAGDGTVAYHDPIRVPHRPPELGRPNPYFVEFYRGATGRLLDVAAAEHTAQVNYNKRVEREERFGAGDLAVLFCSPTMELGVDIRQLNVVNMRNVPPTPANYAQRSGRAGRGGQPALVYTYCTSGSPHDRYFFRRPAEMVAGVVAPPKIDLANEDLLRPHIHSIWLAESGLDLGTSLKSVLDLADPVGLPLLEHVRAALSDAGALARTRLRAERFLATIGDLKAAARWYHDRWLDDTLNDITNAFERACERWRELYRTAHAQAETQHRHSLDPTRSAGDREHADRLRREARQQLTLLTAEDAERSPDFYSYRYFAGEGFLPGYNFPRLPISAYLPAADPTARDEYLSRPRFLAISEFGPRAIVYHEGAQYVIDRVIFGASTTEGGSLATSSAKICDACGYLHPIAEAPGPDNCEQCGTVLPAPLPSLFRLRNVSTRRRERISSDEEERMRMGYEIVTGVRFVRHGGRAASRTARVEHGDETLASLTYGDGAMLWRINLGWARREVKGRYGFLLDAERGYWEKNEKTEASDRSEPMSPNKQRVIPYVEDSRNCLVLRFERELPFPALVSLQAALKHAIQAEFVLEDSELAVETLPQTGEPRALLFYEASEGGAGVLRRMLDRDAVQRVARRALGLCHFDPVTGDDLHGAPGTTRACGAACYDCLLSYYNQRHHDLLDRMLVRDLLLQLAASDVRATGGPAIGHDGAGATQEHDAMGERNDADAPIGDSAADRWLAYVIERGYNRPDARDHAVPGADIPATFLYRGAWGAVFIDGAASPAGADEPWEDRGYTVVRFADDASGWDAVFAEHPTIFGAPVR